MTRVGLLNRRYAASAALQRDGVEIVAIGDPLGARFNTAARTLMLTAREDGPGLWDDLVGAVRALRWRLLTQPQPIALNPALTDGAEEVLRRVRLLRGAVQDESLLDEIASAAVGVSSCDPELGQLLLRSIDEVGVSECVVIASNARASEALGGWLGDKGIEVLTPGALERTQPQVEQAYVVGPPRFFRSSLVTAPLTNSLSFLIPAWFGDRQIPRSAISAYAEGAMRIEARVFTEGDTAEPEAVIAGPVIAEEDFLPQPLWSPRQALDREPGSDEVEAHKLLLSGGQAMWLDDGERIRAVDLLQPHGERVVHIPVSSVRVGTYLLLRQGETEHHALHIAALARLASLGPAVEASQQSWKKRLQQRLSQHGQAAVVNALRGEGVKTAERARAWTDPTLVRPHSDQDFERLLAWLDLPIQPHFGNATLLRRAIYQASAEVRVQLESAVSAADVSVLERDGSLGLDLTQEGFRGMLATRVIAISPHADIVPRRDARVPFEDRSGQWLE